ncbi:MAG: ABC transporter permease, partial [Pseudomonadota bacterium]|nr:ABC transporter permease [Pseudomonadota bacterium]
MSTALSNIAWISPFINIAKGEDVSGNIQTIIKATGLPLAGLLVFLLIWQAAASNINTSLGQFPGPGEVMTQTKGLWTEHVAEREKATAFYERQEKR